MPFIHYLSGDFLLKEQCAQGTVELDVFEFFYTRDDAPNFFEGLLSLFANVLVPECESYRQWHKVNALFAILRVRTEAYDGVGRSSFYCF